jgi:hypothetical protein
MSYQMQDIATDYRKQFIASVSPLFKTEHREYMVRFVLNLAFGIQLPKKWRVT